MEAATSLAAFPEAALIVHPEQPWQGIVPSVATPASQVSAIYV